MDDEHILDSIDHYDTNDALMEINDRRDRFGITGNLCGSKWDDKVIGNQSMPLTELRMRVGISVVDEGRGVNETARLFGVSKGFVSRYARIYRSFIRLKKGSIDVSTDIFRSISNRPKNIVRRISDIVVNEIIKIRTEYPFFGSAKIRVYLKERLKDRSLKLPSLTSIDRILRRNGLMDDKKDRIIDKEYDRFERERSMDLLQIDYKDWKLNEDGELICSIWAIDDCSRTILDVKVSDHHSADDVIRLLDNIIKKFGRRPKQILSDHGSEFAATSNGCGKLDIWCMENGIEHIMGKVKHPQTQGKIERSHGSAVREISFFGNMDTLDNAKDAIENWIVFYNTCRPHQAIGYEYPIIRFFDRLDS